MTSHQKDQILKIVSYYMDHKLRAMVMMEAPLAYNAWVEANVVDVVHVSDGQPVIEGYMPKVAKNYQPKEPPKNP